MANQTSDAYSWTQEDGLKIGGFKCEGVISPPTNTSAPQGHVYDVIVIGAGYAGLSAARDLATTRHSVLMLEGRDRIGGRTFSVDIEGFKYEMGGTWVSHYQPYAFTELRRYGLDKELVATRQHGYENDYYTLNIPGIQQRKMSHEEAGAISAKVWNRFVDVDGHLCRRICPLPYQQLGNAMVSRQEVEKLDKLSCWDRFQQVKNEFTAEESAMLLGQLLMLSGGNLEESSLWDMIRSQALGAHDSANFEDIWLLYKLKAGQSHLARRMFEEAVETGLDYFFNTPVVGVKDSLNPGDAIEVQVEDGRIFRARRVISTVPLNVLKDIQFSPPLAAKRHEAIEQGHICFMTKIHAEVKGSGLVSWRGTAYPNNLLFGFGDGLTAKGNTHITAFGGKAPPHFVPERNLEKIHEALQALHPMEIQRLVFHNWNSDRFSQAGPCWWAPEFMTKYQEELQSRHGNVFFASADWADGWRAFIDGALEQGRKNAQEVAVELRVLKTRGSLR
ncbi:uncharacterized protein N7459_000212 [Penicillium hispanicum]|uniref:uncharacterized protein n=1 Tax=Penicillium hispanicum TaxID=1080232 RepID=UPI002540D398|nr:uncharacterized protein N7459_000212 [Penicillium hispanicum]KAJ5594004.1 hypothetical protein N7459_000212 [Penicillium hispanicum]